MRFLLSLAAVLPCPAFAQKAWVINVADYTGVTCNGSGDDSVGINAAIDDFNNVGDQRGVLIFPRGICVIGTSLHPITAGGTIQGAGKGDSGSLLLTKVTNSPVLHVTSLFATTLTALQIRPFSGYTMTDGAGIEIEGNGSSPNSNSNIDDVKIAGMFRGIWLKETVIATISSSYIVNSISVGVLKSNLPAAMQDMGDDTISSTTFDRDPAISGNSYAVLQQAGGGLKMIGNKVDGHTFGYALNVYPGAQTSDLLLSANSFENQLTSAVLLDHGAGSSFSNVNITGNQVALSPQFLKVNAPVSGETAPWLNHVVIASNTVSACTNGITILSGSDYLIGQNTITPSGQSGCTANAAITLSTDYPTGALIGPNTYRGFPLQIADNGNSMYRVVQPTQTVSASVSTTSSYGALFAGSTVVTLPGAFEVTPRAGSCTWTGSAGVFSAQIIPSAPNAATIYAYGVINGGSATVTCEVSG